MANTATYAELKRIADRNGGILRAEDVVEEARNENSPLHSSFNWDDTDAARLWRLHQARNIIRVTYIECKKVDREVRAFVSLTPDREEDGGGYREIVRVLSNRDQRRQMLDDAMRELEVFTQKYAVLEELALVFDAAKNVKKMLK